MEDEHDDEEETLLAATAKAWGAAPPGQVRHTGDAVEVRARCNVALHFRCL